LRDRILNYEERIEQLRQHALSASKSHIIFQGFTEAAENRSTPCKNGWSQKNSTTPWRF
jgi:hypothetical protein